jgi:acid stress-induced BolA-like protein IbaG/YrbA
MACPCQTGNTPGKMVLGAIAFLTHPPSKRNDPMITPDQVSAMIKAGLPDASVQVQDLTGGGDHYQVVVVSSQFAGRSLVQQHQLVYGAVREAMSSEAIHALALKTYTPEDWAAQSA